VVVSFPPLYCFAKNVAGDEVALLAYSLVVLRKASVRFDAAKDFTKLKAKVLYVLSRTDKLFPPSIAPRPTGEPEARRAAGAPRPSRPCRRDRSPGCRR